MSPNRKCKRAGISIIEMLIIVAIVVILIGLVLPVLQRIREQAAVKETAKRLKEVTLALHSCHDIYKRFPPAWGPFPPPAPGQPSSGPSGTVHYWLLPFIGPPVNNLKPLPPGTRIRDAWTDPKVYSQVIPEYVDLSDCTTLHGTVMLDGGAPWGVGFFAANARVFGGLKATATATAWDNKASAAIVTDGTSNCIAFATRFAHCGLGGSAWAGGNTTAGFDNFMLSGAFFASDIEDIPVTGVYTRNPPFQVTPSVTECYPDLAHGYTSAGIQVSMFDGSVRSVSPTISSATWGQACHPSDGDVIEPVWIK